MRFSTGWIWIVWVNGIFRIGFTQREEDVIRFARVELLCLVKPIFLAQWRFVIGDFANLGLCGSSIYPHLSTSSRWTLSVIANTKTKRNAIHFVCAFVLLWFYSNLLLLLFKYQPNNFTLFGGQKWSGFGWEMPACNQAPALKMFYCLWKIYRLLFSVVFRSVLFFEFMFRFVRRIMNFRDSLKILINPILNGMFIRSYPKPYTKYKVYGLVWKFICTEIASLLPPQKRAHQFAIAYIQPQGGSIQIKTKNKKKRMKKQANAHLHALANAIAPTISGDTVFSSTLTLIQYGIGMYLFCVNRILPNLHKRH